MSIERQFGEPALFEILRGDEIPVDLSVREQRILAGACAFHALMAPGRTLRLIAYDGGPTDLPRTTDDSSFNGASRAFQRRLWTAEIRSLVADEPREHSAVEAPADELIDSDIRHIHIPRDSVLDFDPPRDLSPDPVRRALRAIRSRTPLLYDQVRDVELLRHRRPLHSPVPRRDYAADFLPGGIHEDARLVPAVEAPAGAPRAVLVGMHWFEMGGAERWAFETVRMIRDAGFVPIVLANRDSHQPWIDRAELDGAVTIPFSEATALSQTPGVEELLRAILRTWDVRGVFVHHNQWLYDRLPWIRASRPQIPIIDTTHIVEYRGGGYPASAVMADAPITKHHVISPALERWMRDVQGIDADKIVMAPLVGLTVAEGVEPAFRPRSGGPFTVSFVGRIARQKAPEVFVEAVGRIHAADPSIRFIMHGDGDMAGAIEDFIAGKGLADVIIRRDSSVPVAETYAESDLLMITAHNEGLTLTTLEAIAAGVPVISTDVGAQSDIVPARALTSRNAFLAARAQADLALRLAGDEAARRQLWHDEREAEKILMNTQSAGEWFAQEVATW